MSLRLSTSCLVALALVGCNGKTKIDTTAQDDTGYAIHDTGLVDSEDSGGDDTQDTHHTGDTDHTGDSDSGETADTTESGDSGGTGVVVDTVDTAGHPDVRAITVSPGAMTVNPGATYPSSALVLYRDGTSDTPTDLSWSTDDPKVATVDAFGVVTALFGGTTTLHATYGGVEGTATITVTADLTATVTVTNALDGTPIEGATVEVEGGASAVTDASGIATVAVPDAGPQDITALVDDSYSAVTWLGVTTRSLAIPLTPKSTTTDGLIDGTMDFTGVDDAAWNQIVIGLVPAAFSQALPTVSLQSLFGADRTVTVFGTDVTLPANLVIEGTEETYEVGAPPGDVGVWGFAGPILTSDVTHATGGPGDAINLLLDNLGAMSWGWLGGGTVTTGGTTTLDLAPADSFADTLSVSLPGLPLGFHGDETWFVMTADECREGWVVTGLGQGTTGSTVERVPDGTSGCRGDQSVLATAEVGGLGSGGATTSTTATDDGTGTWTFDDPQDTPSVDAWDPATRALTVSVDSDATFVRIRMEDNRYNVHDYFTAGSYSGTVPGDFSAFHRPQASIEVWSLDASGASYDERATTGSADPREFQVRTSAVVTREP